MKRKSNVPATSKQAYHNLDPVKLSQMHKDIVRALEAIGEGNFEAIAAWLGVKEQKVWKRLSEAERAGVIYKPGHTILTKSGANSYVYRPTTPNSKEERVVEKALPGKSVVDYSRAILKQEKLF